MQYGSGPKARGADNPALLSASEFYIICRNLSSEPNIGCKALPDLCADSPQFSGNTTYGSVDTSCHSMMSFLFVRFKKCNILQVKGAFFISAY